MRYRLDGTTVGSIQDLPRPEHLRQHRRFGWPGIWPRMHFPRTQLALYLWESPANIVVVGSHDDINLYFDADLHIAGGTVFECEDTDWAYPILVGAGYTMIPVD